MIARKIRADEYKRVQEIAAHAFHEEFEDAELSPKELFEQLVRDPMDREDMNWDSRWAVFDDDDKTMLSTLITIPYQAQFDGHIVPLTGIGGVATLPQYRGQGCVRACLSAVFQALYEENAAFSYLHPFSSAFYRKFGYAPACEKNCYRVRLAAIPDIRVSGTYRLLEAGTNFQADIERVYRAWFDRYNFMTNDEDIEYIWVRRASPFLNNVYSYIYYSAGGEPAAFMTYRAKQEAGARTLICTRFFFVGPEGCKALLALLKKETARYDAVEFTLPVDIDLTLLLPEWRHEAVVCRREQNGMIRVIHAEQVLRSARMRGTGSLKIRVIDKLIPENNDCFAVSFQDGVTSCVKRCTEDADITLPIRDFSLLICGRCDMEMLPYLPEVRLCCDPEQAGKVFYRKPLYISREF